MRYVASGASVIGPRHEQLSEPNQDAILLNGNRGGWIFAVADGLGSRSRSDIGAQVACKMAKRVLRDSAYAGNFESSLEEIHSAWVAAVNPYCVDLAATTLLLGSVNRQGSVRVAQLGDGLILMRQKGKFSVLSPSREGFSNQTWALSRSHEPKRWVIAKGNFVNPGDGVVLMTDGVSEDLAYETLPEFMEAIYRNILKRNRRRGRRWLESELTNWATPLHSDDKSLVAVFGISS
jgi:serine/threonine protein phosphatase PrpC